MTPSPDKFEQEKIMKWLKERRKSGKTKVGILDAIKAGFDINDFEKVMVGLERKGQVKEI